MATDVSNYEDYRLFMRDRFSELQARQPDFSQRRLALRARIANPGFFNEVIKGRRRLSPAAAAKMAVGLELSPWETDYFSNLVEYVETRDQVAKIKAGRRMVALKNRRLYHILSSVQSPTETLREILRELERDWVLQAAALSVDYAMQETLRPVLNPVSEATLRGIVEKLSCLRAKAEADPDPQVVHFTLQMSPRMAD